MALFIPLHLSTLRPLNLLPILLLSLPTTSHPTSPSPPSNNNPDPLPNLPGLYGLPSSEPTCYSLAGSPAYTDCVAAYDLMEQTNDSHMSTYVGNSALMPSLADQMGENGLRYILVPRIYAYGSCVIEVSTNAIGPGLVGSIYHTDSAHPNAIKIAAGNIIDRCVFSGVSGGVSVAGLSSQLRIRVLSLSRLSPQSLSTYLRQTRQQNRCEAVTAEIWSNSLAPPSILSSSSSADDILNTDGDIRSTCEAPRWETGVVNGYGIGRDGGGGAGGGVGLPVGYCRADEDAFEGLGEGSAQGVCGWGFTCMQQSSPSSSSAAASGAKGGPRNAAGQWFFGWGVGRAEGGVGTCVGVST